MSVANTSAVTGTPAILLRLEGLLVLVLATWLYSGLMQGWWHFFAWFLLPDVALLLYLSNARLAAAAYNATHSYLGALALTAYGFGVGHSQLLGLGLIWVAHIGFDRALGYGLKYSAGFKFTHLGVIGRKA